MRTEADHETRWHADCAACGHVVAYGNGVAVEQRETCPNCALDGLVTVGAVFVPDAAPVSPESLHAELYATGAVYEGTAAEPFARAFGAWVDDIKHETAPHGSVTLGLRQSTDSKSVHGVAPADYGAFLRELVARNPNDADLGSAIRVLVLGE